MTKSFPRSLKSLESILEFCKERAKTHQLSSSRTYELQLITEEIFTNLVKYDPNASPDIPVTIERRNDTIIISLENINGNIYDITKSPKADTDAPLEDRPIGGLGLHLVKQYADDISYSYRDDTGYIVIKLKLENTRAEN